MSAFMTSVPLLAAGDLTLFAVCLGFALYEGWLDREHPADERHRSALVVALGTGVYALGMSLEYTTRDARTAHLAVNVQWLALIVLVHGLLSLSVPLTGRPLPWPRKVEAAFGLGWALAIAATSWVVADTVTPLTMTFLDRPYLQPSTTPMGLAFLVSYLALGAFAATRVARVRRDAPDTRGFGAALTIWAVCGAFDIAGTVGLLAQVPLFLMEYGFFALALALVAGDVRRYGALLRQVEASQAKLLESFRALIESAPIGVLVHAKGQILYANPESQRMLGYGSGEPLVGRPLMELIHPEDRGPVAARVGEIVTTSASAPHRDARMLRRDGTSIIVDVVGVPTVFADQPAVLAMGQDVTESRGLLARTMQLDRMVAVGTLAAGVAHEINNPLAYVMANLEFVADELEDLSHPAGAVDPLSSSARLEEVLQALTEARGGAGRVRDIVRDMGLFSREDSHAEEPFALAPVIESALNMAWNQVRHRARLVRDVRALPAILGSSGKLGQVVLNLVVNAAQSIPEGHAEEHTIRVAASTDARGWAQIDVSDTGSGIPLEVQKRVFDPFFTTKPPGQGTGLGLSICRSIVLAHHGEITFESVVGHGTTFRLSLPPSNAASAAEEVPTPAPSRASDPKQRRRVLIVDDEPLVARAMERILRGEYDVTLANTGAQALDCLERGPAFDAILSDLMMPTMTGVQLHAEVRRRWPALAERMVFVTGGAFSDEARVFLQETPNARVEKPHGLTALRSVLAKVLAR